MTRVYVARLTGGVMTSADVLDALGWLEWEEWLPRDARVFIKPNLTWPKHIPGVTTTPQAIEAVVAAISSRTGQITVGESDGSCNAFTAEEAFQGHGIYDICSKYKARAVNLSKEPAREFADVVGGRPVRVILPLLLVEETDVFITLPVPKVHAMTGVSLAFKNQWGCIPSAMRLREHPRFEDKILAINRRLNPKVIMDGTYFLDGVGPMSGEAIPKQLILAGNSAGAADMACCAIMGIDPDSIRHLKLAKREGLSTHSLSELQFNQTVDSFRDRNFNSHRAFLDWLSLLGFRSPFFGWLFWGSPISGIFRQVLYSIRRHAWIGRLLYGKAGPPPDNNPSGG